MRIPFRHLHLVPTHICMSPACVHSVLHDPVFSRVPVLDAIGIDYAYDIQVTQGFYVLVLAYVCLRWLRDRVIEGYLGQRP